MKMGLVRHYKVSLKLPEKKFLTCQEVIKWFKAYDEADIECGKVQLGDIEWTKCFTSDLPRAVKTAEKIYKGDILRLGELREFSFRFSYKGNLRLPFMMWVIILRIKTLLSRRDKETFRKPIVKVLDNIVSENKEDVLIVSHGFTMLFLKRELIKRGFIGPKFKSPKNGKLYVFEKN